MRASYIIFLGYRIFSEIQADSSSHKWNSNESANQQYHIQANDDNDCDATKISNLWRFLLIIYSDVIGVSSQINFFIIFM